MEPFGFTHFIYTTWNIVVKFLDKVNWNVFQMSCNTSHSCCRFPRALFTFSFSMYVHTCSMMLMSGLWTREFRTVKLQSRFLFSRFPDIKLLLIRAFPTGTAWWMSICLYLRKVILYRCPTPLYVIEPDL